MQWKKFQVFKAALFAAALLPFARLALFALTDPGRLGANPIEFITRNTGDWTLYFLCMTLATTPLRRITKWNELIKLRRMLGLFSFFYAALHFTTFLWFDHFFDIEEMLRDVVKRPFITVGFIAFLLMIPLAATSTNGMIRRLGGKRWLWLHRMIYLIAPLGILHFWWMKAGKHDFAQPVLFGAIIALLLLLRVYWKIRQVIRLQRCAIWLLARFGWRLNFTPLPGPHGVVIVYPHTSNWDFIVGILAIWASGAHIHWLGKEALFQGVCGMVLGPLLRSWDGEPIERSISTGAIGRIAARMKGADTYWLALAPEGTRRYQDGWRSGFYHIALAADVPVGMACIDYRLKEVRLLDYAKMSGDVEADLARIRAAYRECRGFRHEWASPIVFTSTAEQRFQRK